MTTRRRDSGFYDGSVSELVDALRGKMTGAEIVTADGRHLTGLEYRPGAASSQVVLHFSDTPNRHVRNGWVDEDIVEVSR